MANNVPDYLHICTVVVAWPLISTTTNHENGKDILFSRYLNKNFLYIYNTLVMTSAFLSAGTHKNVVPNPYFLPIIIIESSY